LHFQVCFHNIITFKVGDLKSLTEVVHNIWSENCIMQTSAMLETVGRNNLNLLFELVYNTSPDIIFI
jgi:hypothetical protein